MDANSSHILFRQVSVLQLSIVLNLKPFQHNIIK